MRTLEEWLSFTLTITAGVVVSLISYFVRGRLDNRKFRRVSSGGLLTEVKLNLQLVEKNIKLIKENIHDIETAPSGFIKKPSNELLYFREDAFSNMRKSGLMALTDEKLQKQIQVLYGEIYSVNGRIKNRNENVSSSQTEEKILEEIEKVLKPQLDEIQKQLKKV